MAKSKPLVTVITPSFNQGGFIGETIESVLNQNEDVEHLIFDGGSTDDTVAVLRSYGPEISWVSEPDRGQADAVNKGLKNVSSEIIGWLNSDDIYYPDALEKVLKLFHDHPDVDIVYGRADHLDASGLFIEEYPTEEWDFERLKEICFICQPTVFFRKKIVEEFGVLDDSLNFCMDYEYWLRIGRDKDFYFLNEKLAGSRLYGENKTLGSAVGVHEEILKMFKEKFGEIPIRWIYGYAIVYAREIFKLQKKDCGGIIFPIVVAVVSLFKTIQYRNRTSYKDLKRAISWFGGGLLSR